MIVREKDPENLEMQFAQLEGAITSTEQFYVRSHFSVPEIDLRKWRLKIEGAVAREQDLTCEELRKFPARTIEATLECAGNSRIFLVPKAKGVQWELGAVGNAEWTGVPLQTVLQEAGVAQSAVEVILEGADHGSIAEPPRPAREINFTRSLPLEKAMDDVLLAYEMNGQPLTTAHGFPLRAIVPGWYGVASIKWLQRIVVTEKPFVGYFQSVDYGYWQPTDDGPVLRPLQEMQVKAEIARPTLHETLPANANYLIAGAAWSAAEIAGVEVSTDGGAAWKNATLLGASKPNAWRLWEFPWTTPEGPCRRTLLARAIDSLCRRQPEKHDQNRGSYMINHWLPIEVEIR